MNPELNKEEIVEVAKETHLIFTVTKTSKYLALLLFIFLPFIGGYVGYMYAPEKVVEVEKVVVKKTSEDLTGQMVVDEVNKLGFYGYVQDSEGENTKYILLGNKVFSVEGGVPSNGGKEMIVEISNKDNFSVLDFDFFEYGEGSGLQGYKDLDLGVIDNQVYFKSQRLEGVDADKMKVSGETYSVGDEDTIFFYQSNCQSEFFVEGTFDEMGVYKPSC